MPIFVGRSQKLSRDRSQTNRRVTIMKTNLANTIRKLTNKRRSPANGSNTSSVGGVTSLILPVLLLLTIFVANGASVYATNSTLTMSIDNTTLSLDILPHSTNGDFAKSDNSTISVTTNNYSGYTLSIAASSSTNLTGTNGSIASIGSAVSEADFSADTTTAATNYNGKWGYLPSKLNSSTNTSFQPSPGTGSSGHTLDVTSTANATTPNTYTLAIGARVGSDTAPGGYSNTFVVSAVANLINYSITYNKGNTTDTVSGLPSNTTGTISDPLTGSTNVTLSSTTPTRSGKVFNGWCTVLPTAGSPDTCSGTTIASGGTYNLNAANDPAITLYAMWKSNGYTISYNANGGSGSITSQEVTPGSSVTLADNAFTRSNYYFKGWATTSGGSVAYRTNQSITPTGDMTLYAVWGDSTNTSLYNIVASLTRGNGTNNNNATTGIKTSPTKATSGVYTYDASTFGTPSDASTSNAIYYYRGILDNVTGTYGSDGDSMDYPNYVKLGITCWRIVRTTGSGGVKMIYNGMYGNTTSGSCANATEAAQIRATSATTATSTATFTSAFAGTSAAQYRSIVGVGYTRNNTYASTSATTATAYSTLFGTNSSYSGNSTNSNIKGKIETWFTNNLNSYASKLEASAGYCNDRSIRTSSSSTSLIADSTTIVPYGTSSMTEYYFGPYVRNMTTSDTPTLTCPRSTVDLYTTSSASNGNKQLSKPVALLTADEMSFAGSGSPTASNGSGYNPNSYLHSGSRFWLLSPGYRYSSGAAYGFYLYLNGYLYNASVGNAYGVRPAISLTSGTTIASSSGTATDPWVIEAPAT